MWKQIFMVLLTIVIFTGVMGTTLQEPTSSSNDEHEDDSQAWTISKSPDYSNEMDVENEDLRAPCSNDLPCTRINKKSKIGNTSIEYFSCSERLNCEPGKQVNGSPKDISTCVGRNKGCVTCKRYAQSCDKEYDLCCDFYVNVTGRARVFVNGGNCVDGKCSSPCLPPGTQLASNQAPPPNCDPSVALNIPCCKADDACVLTTADPIGYQCRSKKLANLCEGSSFSRLQCNLSKKESSPYDFNPDQRRTFCSCGPKDKDVGLCIGKKCTSCGIVGEPCKETKDCCPVTKNDKSLETVMCTGGKCELCIMSGGRKTTNIYSEDFSCKVLKCCDSSKTCKYEKDPDINVHYSSCNA